MSVRNPFLLLLSLFVGGCAFTTSSLDVSYDPAEAREGPLSSLELASFSVVSFTDKRTDKRRIGYKKNGLGMNTADIVTNEPVEDLVRNAVMVALTTNGHEVLDTGVW